LPIGAAGRQPGLDGFDSLSGLRLCRFVGQLAKLRADWQSARAAIANRRAG